MEYTKNCRMQRTQQNNNTFLLLGDAQIHCFFFEENRTRDDFRQKEGMSSLMLCMFQITCGMLSAWVTNELINLHVMTLSSKWEKSGSFQPIEKGRLSH